MKGFLPKDTLASFSVAGSPACILLPVIFMLPLSLGFEVDVIFIAAPFFNDLFPVTVAVPPGEFKSTTAVPEISITEGVLLPSLASSTIVFDIVVPAFNATVPALASINADVGFVAAPAKYAELPSTLTSRKLRAEPPSSTLNIGPVSPVPLVIVAGPSVFIGGVLL